MADNEPSADGFDINQVVAGTADNPADPIAAFGGSNDSDGDDRTFDPERHLGRDRVNADGTFRRKRKRKHGAGSSPGPRGSGEKTATHSVSAVEGVLFSIHGMLAASLSLPDLAISEAEANNLAKAVVEVQRHYPNSVFSPKVAAWLNLGMIAGAMYGPRVYNIRATLRQRNARPIGASAAPPKAANGRGAKTAQPSEPMISIDPITQMPVVQ